MIKKHCKPISRILFYAIIYLSRKLPIGINLPTLYRVHFSAELKRAALNDTIRGISACKVYPLLMLPSKAVGFYSTFSSLPSEALAKEGLHQFRLIRLR